MKIRIKYIDSLSGFVRRNSGRIFETVKESYNIENDSVIINTEDPLGRQFPLYSGEYEFVTDE